MDQFFVEINTNEMMEIIGDGELPDKYFRATTETMKERTWVLEATVPSWEYMIGFLPDKVRNPLLEHVYTNSFLKDEIGNGFFCEKVIKDYSYYGSRTHMENWICGNGEFWMMLYRIVNDYSKYDRQFEKTADQIRDLIDNLLGEKKENEINSNLYVNLDIKDAEDLRARLLENSVAKAANRLLFLERCQEREDAEEIKDFVLGIFEGMVDLICDVFTIEHDETMSMITHQVSIEKDVQKILTGQGTDD